MRCLLYKVYTLDDMNKFFPTLSLAALVISVALPMNAVRAASSGDLVKCDDFSAVYYLAEDGQRYVFPNEHIYFSWYPDFHDVKTISCDDLATIPLGGSYRASGGNASCKKFRAIHRYLRSKTTACCVRFLTKQ